MTAPLRRLLIATQNPGKRDEIAQALAPLGWQVLTPAQVPAVAELDVEETGTTLAENAELKARAFAEATQMMVLADDTGLEITALHGEPGVKSKRYFGNVDEHTRNLKLIEKMAGLQDRSAQFVTVLAVTDPTTNQVRFFRGVLKGRIADRVSSVTARVGVGYDGVFIPEGYNQTLSELGPEIKNTLSHRARAVASYVKYLHSL